MLSLVFTTSVQASVQPTIEWYTSVDVSRPTEIYGISPTSDDGAILAGLRTTGENNDGILIKVNSVGEKVWEKTHTTTETDYYMKAVQTNDGGFIAVGTRYLEEGHYDIIVVKTDSSGTIEWQETEGGSGDDYGYSVIQDTNGDIVWVGLREHGGLSKVTYGKRTSSGEFVTSIFQLTPSIGHDIIETSDGGYLVVGDGVPSSELGSQMMLIKLNGSMAKEWTSYYGHEGDDHGLDVIETKSGDFLAVGYESVDETHPILFKVSESGATLETAEFSNYDSWLGTDLVQVSDGSIIVSGRAFGEDFPCYYAGYSEDLSEDWLHEFQDQDIILYDMILTTDGELLFGGTLTGDIDKPALLKTSQVGNPVGNVKITVKTPSNVNVEGAQVTSDFFPLGQTPLNDLTNSHGFVMFSDVRTGDYNFLVNMDGYYVEMQPVTVTSGETTEVTITLEEEHAQLTVSVMDDHGVPLEGASVSAMTKTDVGIMGSTDATGEVVFSSVTPGIHSVQVSLDGYESEIKQITCETGVASTESYTLQSTEVQDPEPVTDPETPETVSVTINVSSESGALRGVSISSVTCPEGQNPLSGTTNTSGDAQFNILPGEYELKLSRTGYQTTTESITVSSSGTYDLSMSPESTDSTDDTTSGDDNSTSGDTSSEHGTSTGSETSTDDSEDTDGTEGSTPDEPMESGNNNMLYVGVLILVVAIIGVVYYLKTKDSL